MNSSFGSFEKKIWAIKNEINKKVIPMSGCMIKKNTTKVKNKKDNIILKIGILCFDIKIPLRKIKKGFIISLGCKEINPKFIHLFEPLISGENKET